MRVLFVALALLSVVAAVSASSDPTTSLPGVQDLTPDNFDKFVGTGKAALVEFYAPWCGHCKHLTPEYKKLGEAIQNDPVLSKQVVVAKVDADKHKPIGSKFGVRGFPTLKWFARGSDKPEDYNDARTSDAMLTFIKDKLAADKSWARIEDFDKYAKSFLKAATGSTSETVKLAEEAALKLKDEAKDNADLYIKYMKKAVEKGNDWLATETARLERLMTGSMSAEKLAAIRRKLSVLSAFASDDEEQDTKEE